MELPPNSAIPLGGAQVCWQSLARDPLGYCWHPHSLQVGWSVATHGIYVGTLTASGIFASHGKGAQSLYLVSLQNPDQSFRVLEVTSVVGTVGRVSIPCPKGMTFSSPGSLTAPFPSNPPPGFLCSGVPHGLLTPEVLLDGQSSLSFSEELFSLEPATDVLLYHNTTLPELIQSEFL